MWSLCENYWRLILSWNWLKFVIELFVSGKENLFLIFKSIFLRKFWFSTRIKKRIFFFLECYFIEVLYFLYVYALACLVLNHFLNDALIYPPIGRAKHDRKFAVRNYSHCPLELWWNIKFKKWWSCLWSFFFIYDDPRLLLVWNIY